MDGFHLAILFSVGLAGFLLGCLASLFFEPSDELGCDGADGDWPALPQDMKVSRFHSERNTL
jgi:hypothetical protein